MNSSSGMEMEQLVAAFTASVTMSDPALRLPTPPSVQMEELAATFASSLTMSDDPAAAQLPVSTLPHGHQEDTPASNDDDGQPEPPNKGEEEEEACVLRVRFPDGRVHCRSFGAGRPVAALYRYCRSALVASGASAARARAFRLVKLAGGASDEVRGSSSTSLRDLGLHHCAVHVVLT